MPLRLEDRMEILDLAARYSHATDHGEAEALADTFTEDGIFEGAGEPRQGRAAHIARRTHSRRAAWCCGTSSAIR